MYIRDDGINSGPIFPLCGIRSWDVMSFYSGYVCPPAWFNLKDTQRKHDVHIKPAKSAVKKKKQSRIVELVKNHQKQFDEIP